MSADFFASYVSGALGILIGNHLDVLKVQYQTNFSSPVPAPTTTTTNNIIANTTPPTTTTQTNNLTRLTHYFRGAAAPIIGYGALNSILFLTYNRTLTFLDPSIFSYTKLAGVSLTHIWTAGAIGGLATWVVSTPSEYVKCRAQLLVGGQTSSYGVLRDTVRRWGVGGLYRGGVVTAVRDGVGYGWYFWSYELCKRVLVGRRSYDPFAEVRAWETLVAGGVAGVVTWVSIYPLDVVKTRVQTGVVGVGGEMEGLLGRGEGVGRRKEGGVREVVREIWRESGIRGFYRGVGICSLRAFIVNAVQWYAYERIMVLLSPARAKVGI